ncbi:YIP1 family protein [Mobilitalea sibirica]|uniref:YIP1 family protein n=1 Tax=Mobilitalea sibirica TaxID=1462919 RepID=A0A8J7HCN3_9FIRM|nr:YIP1 family protein [Mobilitalea sibirica]MBH1941137.1 YIP1 family protein [Mobilitalea sibirica]
MSIKTAFQKDKLMHLGKTLRYSTYLIFRPFDGFWDLTHEKRGSMGAANVILALVVLTQVWQWTYSGFLFYSPQWEYFNLFMQVLPFVVLFLIWCIANWSLTTLMDGKGKLSQIYMATAYAMTPYVLINIPLIGLSHLITWEENAYYYVAKNFSMIWCVILILCAMMMIHDYTLGKAIFSSLVTIVAMMIIIFLIVMFFSLITQSFGYFISLYKEITFRLY